MAQLKSTNITGNLSVTGSVLASKIIKLGGTANEILCADGSTTTLSSLGAGTVTSITVTGNNGLTGTGTVTSTGTITLSHADTSSQASMTTGGRTYINSITLDGYGHVTAIGTGTESNQDLSNYVQGPSSATDNAIVRFNGTGGKTVQNSTATISDSGHLNINTTSDSTMTTPAIHVLHTGPANGSSTADLMVLSGYNSAPYGFKFSTHGSGTAIIQSQRISGGSGETFSLSLNPNGGDVLINGSKAATQAWVTDSYLPLAGGEMTGAGPITYPTASGNNKPNNYISAGGGYATGSGKQGLKILALDQSDATMGLGVDLTGGPYELTVATSRSANTTASKIVFATHTVGTTAYKALATLSASGAENPVVTLNVGGTVHPSSNLGGSLGTTSYIWDKLFVRQIELNRTKGTTYGRISFYSPSMYTWHEYMSNVGSGVTSPTGALTQQYGPVTSWARRSLIENNSGYGWIWEACGNNSGAVPNGKMALSSNTGNLETAGSTTSTSFVIKYGGAAKAALQYNSSDDCIELIWR